MGPKVDSQPLSFANCLAKQNGFIEQIQILKRNYDKTSIARRTRGYISKRIENLDLNWNDFRDNDNILRTFPDYEKSDYATESVLEEIDELYSSFSGELTDVLHALDNPAPVLANNNQDPIINNTQQVPPNAMFRLPQISLPTFSGDYASWAAFEDMFTSLIHANNTLTNVQKLHYLKSNLRGPAANLLRNTTITNDNYNVAWTTLKTRFANKRALVDAQLKILINQESHHSETSFNIRELIDITQESLNALRGLEIDVANWDPLLLFILIKKLSTETHKAWESDQQGTEALSTMKDFITFLEHRFRMLETLSDRQSSSSQIVSPKTIPMRQAKTHATHVSTPSTTKTCPICSNNHYIRACEKFLRMNVADRRNAVKDHRVCFNCLVQGHFTSECKNYMRCQKCNRNHHTLLHQVDSTVHTLNTLVPPTPQYNAASTQSSSRQTSSIVNPFASTPNNDNIVSHTASLDSFTPTRVLLATAMINVVSPSGQIVPLRALIDQGSEVTLLTTNAAQILRLKTKAINIPLSGIGSASAGTVRSLVQIDIRSPQQSSFVLRTNALILNTITSMSPRFHCPAGHWPHIANLTLADPTFGNPGKIDVLLGADVFKEVILPGVIHGGVGTPVAQSTVFGWILSGGIEGNPQVSTNSLLTSLHTCIDIDDRLKSFWEVEEVSRSQPHHTEEEIECEKHFMDNHSKSADGRYIVRLPLRKFGTLGNSKSSALQRFFQLERSLSKDPNRKASYVEFMRNYISLGHMTRYHTTEQLNSYIIPHHAVFKESSSTTKTRVVFDASNKSSNGNSLNDLMLIGPKIQDDLSTILLRWRKYPIAINSDVEKMYRQILIHPADQHLQHILWRESSEDPLIEYVLQTVTYGTSCAPYLAVRTLRQLAIDNEIKFPLASKIVYNDFYVDDLLTGAYTTADAINMYHEVNELMSSAGLKLRKWVSNSSELLSEIPTSDCEMKLPCDIKINQTVTALGIAWNPATDTFNFSLNLPPFDRPFTKRNILSDISTLFDPLGWLAPIIVRSKILMQKLWVKGVSWDEPLDESTIKYWKSLRGDFGNLNTIQVNRWIGYNNDSMELHGFSDASINAYSASIYARIRQPDQTYVTSLLTAKTRVAPLKQISIPRLELCGAVLVAELLRKTQNDLNIPESSVFAWTDSTIVLHWLRAEPRNWKTFIANRVSTIQQAIPIKSWRHVSSSDNPADCASRGLDVVSLRELTLWWKGPRWLKDSTNAWPASDLSFSDKYDSTIDREEHRVSSNIATTYQITSDEKINFLKTFSSIGKLVRITSLCKRFIAKCRKRKIQYPITLLATELQEALQYWLHTSQQAAFYQEIHDLSKNQTLSPKSKLLSLNPFLDEKGILRVGGRLQKSDLPMTEKHPIILHNHCHIATLIIRKVHLESMHGGPQLVVGLVRKAYWILNARNTVRLHIHKCITCHRYRAASATQLMGNLPEPRIHLTRAFTHSGVDYAGPIDLRMSKGRGNASYKGYISLFVCLSTKAIHIEAVSDLTSNAFIAAYRRFVARRGLPAHMYSDNGTNFVGAVKSLRKSHESTLLKVKSEIINNATKSATEWHFIPPSSPHFGGLWEAGVKSIKFHLKRVIGDSKLTYEELSTLLVQIEACLNSRPLAPMTNDPEDLTALTPGHFLIGDSLLAPPDRSYETKTISLLTRWQLVQRYYQTIAIRWQSEYLSRLQQRPKWLKKTRNIEIGDLVLIKDLNVSPSNWPLARVIATHPGTDDLVRVVTVRTSVSTFKRSITKICPLPL